MHDANYDEYREVVEARLLLDDEEQIGKFITYTLTMYPSEEFEDQYRTSKPAVYATGAVLIFLFTAGLFLLYDRLVEDRQEKTSRLARQRGNIVDAMFPAAFRDRLYKVQDHADAQRRHSLVSRAGSETSGAALEAEESATESNTEGLGSGVGSIVSGSIVSGSTARSVGGTPLMRRNSSHISSVANKIKLRNIEKFMKGGQRGVGDPQMSLERGVLEDDPIAELFHNTSIMFSDIVGECSNGGRLFFCRSSSSSIFPFPAPLWFGNFRLTLPPPSTTTPPLSSIVT